MAAGDSSIANRSNSVRMCRRKSEKLDYPRRPDNYPSSPVGRSKHLSPVRINNNNDSRHLRTATPHGLRHPLSRRSSSAARKLPRPPTSSPVRAPPSKRLEITLDKFSQVALPYHLNLIYKHKKNIEHLQKLEDWEEVSKEVIRAAKSVHQLGVLLFEIEVLRTYVEEHELSYFDARVNTAKTSALVAIHALQEMCPRNTTNLNKINGLSDQKPNGKNKGFSNAITYCSNPLYTEGGDISRDIRKSNDSFGVKSLSGSGRVATNSSHQQPGSAMSSSRHLGRKSLPPSPLSLSAEAITPLCDTPSTPPIQTGTLEVLYEDPKEDSISLISGLDDDDNDTHQDDGEDESRRLICNDNDDDDVNDIDVLKNRDLEQRKETFRSWKTLREEITDLQELISEFSPVVTQDRHRGKVNIRNQRTSHLSSTAIYPVAGALLGTCLGGPVGFLAGVKIGGLAAIGGSVFGYSTGIVIKEQIDRQDYIDEFYAQRSRSQKVRATPSPSIPSVASSTATPILPPLRSRPPLLRDRTQSLPDVYDQPLSGSLEDHGLLARSQSARTRHLPPSRPPSIMTTTTPRRTGSPRNPLIRCESATS